LPMTSCRRGRLGRPQVQRSQAPDQGRPHANGHAAAGRRSYALAYVLCRRRAVSQRGEVDVVTGAPQRHGHPTELAHARVRDPGARRREGRDGQYVLAAQGVVEEAVEAAGTHLDEGAHAALVELERELAEADRLEQV